MERELMSLKNRLSSGKFVVLVEINTPKGVDISRIVTDARRIKGRVDAIVIPDMDNGVMRMSALAGGALIHQQGMESIIHVYGRDRNRMALQGDLLAAYVLGIRNLIVVHGEEMVNSDHKDTKPVYDLDEFDLLDAVRTLEGGTGLAGFDLHARPDFVPGCTIAPFADDAAMQKELELAGKKVAAGARFVITPPVFDVDRFQGFLASAGALGVPIIPTVFLIKSVAIARYMATNEPGAYISEEMIKRIRKSADREMEGVRIAGETVAALKELVGGVMIQTLGWEHRLPAILDAAGL